MTELVQEATTNELVSVYRKIRAAIQEAEDAHKENLRDMREDLSKVSDELLTRMEAEEMDSLRTPSGTASRRVQTNYWTSDWGQMYEFIKEHDAFHLLQKRLNNKSMREFLEENPDLLPKGLNADRQYVISVRKPV